MQGLTCLIKPYKTSMFRLFRWNTVRRRIKYLCFDDLAEGFQRRRLKCEKLTEDWRRTTDDGRRTTDAKWWQKLALPLARGAKKKCTSKHKYFILLRTVFHRNNLKIWYFFPLKLLGQLDLSFAKMILWWSPFKILSSSPVLGPRWTLLLQINDSLHIKSDARRWPCWLEVCIVGHNFERGSSKAYLSKV
jgi:hypothetical protein